MFVLRDNYGKMVTGFTPLGFIQTISAREPLRWHSLSDLVKFLRVQPALEPFIPSVLTIHRIIEAPVKIVTEEVK